MPPTLLLNCLTGQQLAEMKLLYNRMPTPLERIENLLSYLITTVDGLLSSTPKEYKGSIIPSRFDMFERQNDKPDELTEEDEDKIESNMHLLMYVHNTVRGAG